MGPLAHAEGHISHAKPGSYTAGPPRPPLHGRIFLTSVLHNACGRMALYHIRLLRAWGESGPSAAATAIPPPPAPFALLVVLLLLVVVVSLWQPVLSLEVERPNTELLAS